MKLQPYLPRISRNITFIILLLLTYTPAIATTLGKDNPFLPPGYNDKKPEAPKPTLLKNGPLAKEIEFRGIVQINGEYSFSVFNKKEQKGFWIKENEMEQGIEITEYDSEKRSIKIIKNGRIELISLMSSSSKPIPVKSSVTVAGASNKNKIPNLPTAQKISNNSSKSNTVPRRRVILPKK